MKTMQQFIEENRSEILTGINRFLNHVPRTASCSCHKSGTDHTHENVHQLDDDELEDWILNDEGLYNWARSEGVEI